MKIYTLFLFLVGYLHLKNQNFKIIALPYILGGIDITRTRFTQDKDKNLILEMSNHRSGGLFIIVFMAHTWRHRKIFNRT